MTMSDEILGRCIEVSDLNDERLRDYRNVRDKDLMRERESFLAEGEVVLRVLSQSLRFRPRSLLLSAGRVSKLMPILEGPAFSGVPMYIAAQGLMDELVGFHIHRGILASVGRLSVPSPGELLARMPEARRILLLEGILNHDNVGGIFRNAAAFGADMVLMDAQTCDPFYRKALRVSVGGSLVVPYGRAGVGESGEVLVKAAKEAGFYVYSLSPRAEAEEIGTLMKAGELPSKIALLLGTEGEGLSRGAMEGADRVLRIEMAPGFDSLNVAVASGIALFALRG